VVIDQVVGDSAANGTFKIHHVTGIPLICSILSTARRPLPPPAPGLAAAGGAIRFTPTSTPAQTSRSFYRVTGDDALGTFLGTFVSVNGVDSNKTTKEKFASGSSAGRMLDASSSGRSDR
jgi:hypothetical protein